VLPADDEAFECFKKTCLSNQNWVESYKKKDLRVSTKAHANSNIKLLKAFTTFSDVSASLVFDVVHDTEYRKKWDHDMIEMKEICKVSVNNTVSYYAVKSPTPIKSRDVVFLSSWIAYPNMREPKEYIMINKSVSHTAYPPRKDMVRAISINTGYLIRPTGATSCEFHYLTQFDPRGSIPKWMVNRFSEIFIPRVIYRIHKAARKYGAWKQKHQPKFKPWLFPEQNDLPSARMGELSRRVDQVDSIDESDCNELKEDRDSLDDGSDEEK